MTIMKIIIYALIALAFIFLVVVAVKKNKKQGEDVDDLSPTKCHDDEDEKQKN